MSLNFTACQYDRSFHPKLLQNWEVPSQYRERPRALLGFTQIVASDRGHLLPGVKRNRESPWGTFVGTWDMPKTIPGNSMTNSTARTDGAMYRLEKLKTDGDIILSGKLKQCKVPSPLPVKADIDADRGLSPKAVGASQAKVSESRSGARNPEPKSTMAIQGSPASKPATPTRAGSRPLSQASRQNGVSPKPLTPTQKPLPPIQSPKPASPTQEASGEIKPAIHWPTPRTADAMMQA